MIHKSVVQVSVLVVALLLIGLVVAAGCGSNGGPGGSTTTSTTVDSGSEVLSTEQALLAERGRTIQVRGALLAPNGGSVSQMVLAGVLLESYPPQAGGATVGLRGLDLEDLVGLSSTLDQPDLSQVVWSDYWMVLGGVIKDGFLQVQQTPRVVRGTAIGATVRFSPVSEPIATGDTVWWAFDVKNQGSSALTLTFASGQRAEVVLSLGGVEEYRWSDGKVFTEAIEDVSLAPGEMTSIVINDALTVTPGEYDLTASVTGSVSGEGMAHGLGDALPRLTTKIRVR